MTLITRTFTREQLAALDVPASAVHTEHVQDLRWTVVRLAVFAHDGAHWRVEYQLGATEYQADADLWFGEHEVTVTRVELRPVTVERWCEVSDEDEDHTGSPVVG